MSIRYYVRKDVAMTTQIWLKNDDTWIHATSEKSKQFCDEFESEFDKNNYSRFEAINLRHHQSTSTIFSDAKQRHASSQKTFCCRKTKDFRHESNTNVHWVQKFIYLLFMTAAEDFENSLRAFESLRNKRRLNDFMSTTWRIISDERWSNISVNIKKEVFSSFEDFSLM